MTARWSRPAGPDVRIEDDFWSPYLQKIRRVMLPHVLNKFEEIGYMENFSALIRNDIGNHKGPPFADGLLFETLRGASDFLAAEYDEALDKRLDEIISLIERASDSTKDGFICTYTALLCPDKRWGENGGDLVHQHDLYDVGALVEAGVSHYLATGKRTLLRCAVRAANLVCREIGPKPKKNIIPGHSLPEEAFLKLFRLFRDHRELDGWAGEMNVRREEYLSVVQFWYSGRGDYDSRTPCTLNNPEYNQNHATFSQQTSAVGHAVRATLCYTGAASLVYETGDSAYLAALDALWENVTQKKLHISGGIGTRHDIEGFDTDYNLPNDAYLETCASIGLIFWAGEMSLLRSDGKYFDCLERALYNIVLSSIGEDAQHHFYQNPLVSDGTIRRWAWHKCPCCPPMLVKLHSSLGQYIYSLAEDALSVNLYIGSTLEASNVKISQKDMYLRVDSKGNPLTLRLRIPEYAERFALTLNGQPIPYNEENGYAVVRRVWNPEDALTAAFNTPIRRICAHPAVEADVGRVAIMRGPYLMCAEGFDNAQDVDFIVAEDPCLEPDGDGAKGFTADGKPFRLIPYYRWCSRESDDQRDRKMAVWFRQAGMPECDRLLNAMGGRLYASYGSLK